MATKKPTAKPKPAAKAGKGAGEVTQAPVKRKPGPPPTAQMLLEAAGTDAIVTLITEGVSYREICKQYGVALATLVTWIGANPERSRACAHAREVSGQAFEELAAEEIKSAADPFELAKAKELAVHYRWRAKAVNPKQYGEKMQLDANLNVNDMSDAELAKRLAEFGVAAIPGGANAGG